MPPRQFDIPPPTGSGDIPEFHKLGGLQFQALCRDLFDREPNIRSCSEYGGNGQGQHGIDCIAHRTDRRLELGQAKAGRTFTPAKIRAVSEEFFRHWELWRTRSVERFILFVGCEVKRTECHEEILKQRARFRELEIDYELWGAEIITNKLRPHPGIVSTQACPN